MVGINDILISLLKIMFTNVSGIIKNIYDISHNIIKNQYNFVLFFINL